jgi:DNA-binding NarL/FixJ family response regulator
VCDDEAALSAVRLEFAAAGWPATLVNPSRVAGECTARTQEVCVVDHMPADAIGHALDALVHGATVLATAADEVVAVQLYDQGRRIVVAEWFDAHHRPTCLGLDQDQIALLLALRSGCTIDAAARSTNLSPRTAARRLTAARSTLGTRSTAEAVTIVGRRVDQLQPPE